MKLSDYALQEQGDLRKCPICNCWKHKLGLASHFHSSHNPEYSNKIKNSLHKIPWNKGLTKESDIRIKKLAKTVSNSMTGKPRNSPSKSTRLKVSEAMKIAHKEGRAWNIGKSRWNNKPSYPEKFFTQVIKNEFSDHNYIREYSLGIYSLDFAWPEKKLCIEIDGEQHNRYKEYKERDERKNILIKKLGWKILRIEWIKMYNDPKYWINIAKQFIEQ